jgi:hypothetical protein
MSDEITSDDFGVSPQVLVSIVEAYGKLNSKGRDSVLKVLLSLSDINLREASNATRTREQLGGNGIKNNTSESYGSFSEDRSMSPKDFIMQKQPRTDVERVTCLAYYLTHYRNTPHFKTVDISTLNTEAAQPKLANVSDTVSNATKGGYLVPATGGNKQISPQGELFAQVLPDREAAKTAMANVRPKRKTRKPVQKKTDES